MNVSGANDALARMKEEHMGQKDTAPLQIYLEAFAAADPEALSARSGVAYDAERACFSLNLLGQSVEVSWPDLVVRSVDTGEEQRVNVRILLACLLLHGQVVPSAGNWVSYPEIPWGEHYFKAFEGRCIRRMVGTYGHCLDRFRAQCQAVGGVPAPAGDAAYDIEFVDGVYVRLIMWEGDDEYPASGQILFSDNAPLAFSAEELAVVGDVLLGAMKRAL